KLSLKKAIDFISDAWEDVSETTIRNCWRTTKIMAEVSEMEGELEKEPQEETTKINDAATIVDDLSAAATNPMTQELKDNIEEYIYMIDQPTTTEDLLTDEGIIEMVIDKFRKDDDDDEDDKEPPPPPINMTEAIEALEKVIRYQESLDVRHG
ncbi:34484_t:CDS:1, partial [Racocetra persica]